MFELMVLLKIVVIWWIFSRCYEADGIFIFFELNLAFPDVRNLFNFSRISFFSTFGPPERDYADSNFV